MPVGINSPARNLFLLGSSGQAAVTNFFQTIDQSAGTDGVYLPSEIKYIFSNQKYALAGTAQDSNSTEFGWFERQDYDLETGSLTTDYTNRVESTQGLATTLTAMELDHTDHLIVVGKTGTVPWIAQYQNNGTINWQATTNSADVEYTGVASAVDTVTNLANYYACGYTSGDAQAFVEKFDVNGNPGWGKSAFMLGRDVTLTSIDANSRREVVAVGSLEDDSFTKGYIVKIDTDTGEVLWDRTLDAGANLVLNDVFIDSNNQIYIVGTSSDQGYIFKYTAEGNLIWQKRTNGTALENFTFDRVKSDGETEQTIVFGTYYDQNGNDRGGVLSKYGKDGNLVWRRTLFSSFNNADSFSNVCLDADPSFYYLMYVDSDIDVLNGTPDAYTFGQVSSSGNGLGGFQYAEGTGETIDYEILNIGDAISRVSDGSVRNDTSDLITYPFTANKIVFDDLSTQVTNKKRQMDDADSFEYSGSPAIRPADFQELNLLGSTGFVNEKTTVGTTNLGAQTWSNDLTTANPNNGFNNREEADKAFDGANNTSASTNSTAIGNQIVWSPSQFPAANGPYTLEVLARTIDNNGGWGDRLLKVNGTTVFDPAVNTLPTDYVTVSNLTEITEVIVERTISSGRSRIDTIKVNGTELIDGQGITLPVSRTTVTKVKDQSGKGNDGVASLTEPFLGAGSVSFDGTGDYLTVGGPLQTTNAGLDLGTNDFCIEYWIYQEVSTYASECFLFDLRETSNTTSTTAFIVNASNQLRWYWGNADRITVNNFIEQNQWTHHAFVRNGDVFTVYKNGTSAGSATIVGQNLGTVPTPCVIGAGRSGGSPVQAKYSNFRITIEDPVYTGNFTPPTTPLTAISGTELLTCQGDTIADASANNFTITVNGNAAPTDDGPTHNATGYWEFDGTDDYITMPAVLPAGADTFTIEAWVRRTGNNSINTAQVIWEQNTIGQTNSTRASLLTNAAGPVSFSGQSCDRDMGYTLVNNEWTHLVCTVDTSDGTNPIKFYLNGDFYSQGQTSPSAASSLNIGTYHCGIGRKFPSNAGNPEWWNGDIGEVRVYPRVLTAAQVFQNYNATKSKYIDEAPDVAPKITSDGIVVDNNLVLNYDFGNRATYDRAENLLPWSEDFTKWNQSVHFWENNYAIAPDGSRTAALLKESIPAQQQLSYFNIATMPNVTVASGDTFTFTVFAKANTHDVLEMHMYGDSQANFNLTTGVTTNNGASMSAVGDGWYFCKWTRTKSNTGGSMYLGISANTYAGVGVDKSLFIWHPQVERGNSYGRYIKTSGTSINAPTTVKNLSSSSITGTLNGPVFSGNSFGFDGSNDNISLPGPINAYPFTVCAWVTNDLGWDPSLGTMDEILNMSIAGQRVSCGIVNNTGWPGRLTLMYGGTSHWTAPKPPTTGPGDWHHIAWTVVGSNNPAHAIYLDGVSQTMTDNGGGHGGSAGWSIGSNNTNGEYWPGSIGEIQIYDRVLSAAEVLQNYNATSAKYGV